MNVLEKINLSTGPVTCAEIGRFDTGPLRQFLTARAAIWTCKYPEPRTPEGLELDRHDPLSSYVVLFEGTAEHGTVIGGCRFIHADEAAALPMSACSSETIVGRAVEISRFFLTPHRELECVEGTKLLQGFVSGLMRFLELGGYEYAYAIIRAPLFLRLVAVGVRMRRIGLNHKHAGKLFVPAQVLVTKQAITADQCTPTTSDHHYPHALRAA